MELCVDNYADGCGYLRVGDPNFCETRAFLLVNACVWHGCVATHAKTIVFGTSANDAPLGIGHI